MASGIELPTAGDGGKSGTQSGGVAGGKSGKAAAPASTAASGSATGTASIVPSIARSGSGIPLIGHLPVGRQYSTLALVLLAVLVLLGAVIAYDANLDNQLTSGLVIASDTQMHSQRLAKAVPNAVQGNAEGFKQLKESRDKIVLNLRALSGEGSPKVSLPGAVGPVLDAVIRSGPVRRKMPLTCLTSSAT